jgi:hypothetical protein
MQGNPEVRPQDSSPDLGIESGHDAPSSENILKVNNGNSSTEDLQSLRVLNKDLATKLKQTKHVSAGCNIRHGPKHRS